MRLMLAFVCLLSLAPIGAACHPFAPDMSFKPATASDGGGGGGGM